MRTDHTCQCCNRLVWPPIRTSSYWMSAIYRISGLLVGAADGPGLTQRIPFDEWTEVFGSERLTGAILDRLTHHVHILEMNGDSFRLRQSRKTKP
jgi:hypothetical protein